MPKTHKVDFNYEIYTLYKAINLPPMMVRFGIFTADQLHSWLEFEISPLNLYSWLNVVYTLVKCKHLKGVIE